MMRKYMIGLLAVIIAVGAVAFDKPEKRQAPGTKLFYYTAPGGSYLESPVENRANWVFTSATTGCTPASPEKACELLVDDMFIEPDNTLKSSFSIVASQFDANTWYVSGGNASTLYNKQK